MYSNANYANDGGILVNDDNEHCNIVYSNNFNKNNISQSWRGRPIKFNGPTFICSRFLLDGENKVSESLDTSLAKRDSIYC